MKTTILKIDIWTYFSEMSSAFDEILHAVWQSGTIAKLISPKSKILIPICRIGKYISWMQLLNGLFDSHQTNVVRRRNT